MTTEPPIETTEDAFLGGALSIVQPARGYRAGLDAVLLAAASGVTEGVQARVLDAGAGVGVAGLAIARRVGDARLTLVEREPALVALASENAARNGLADRVQVFCMDVARGGEMLHRAAASGQSPGGWIAPGSVTHVIANPPFQTIGRSRSPADPLRSAAHQMPASDLDGWLRFMATVIAADGLATMIHRADALGEVLQAFAPRFGALRIRPLQPRCSDPAIRILVQGRKGSRAPLALLAPITLHEDDGAFTPPVRAALRDGAALDW